MCMYVLMCDAPLSKKICVCMYRQRCVYMCLCVILHHFPHSSATLLPAPPSPAPPPTLAYTNSLLLLLIILFFLLPTPFFFRFRSFCTLVTFCVYVSIMRMFTLTQIPVMYDLNGLFWVSFALRIISVP